MLGLRVVKTDGSPLGWSQAVIRNLLRVIDGLFSYLVGAILIWDSPLRQRLGDRAAKTVVVRRQTVERFSFGKVLIHTGILQLVLTLVGFVIGFLFGVTGNADNIGGYIATLFLIGTITAIIGFTIIGRRVPKAFRWKHLTYVAIGIVVTTWILYTIFQKTLIPGLSAVVTLIQTFVSMGIGGWIANAMK